MTSLEERAAAMQLKYLQDRSENLKTQVGAESQKEYDTAHDNEEVSFIDESKITFNQDEGGFSSLGEGDDEDDDEAEAEAIQLIQAQLKEIGALKLSLAKKEQEQAQFEL